MNSAKRVRFKHVNQAISIHSMSCLMSRTQQMNIMSLTQPQACEIDDSLSCNRILSIVAKWHGLHQCSHDGIERGIHRPNNIVAQRDYQTDDDIDSILYILIEHRHRVVAVFVVVYLHQIDHHAVEHILLDHGQQRSQRRIGQIIALVNKVLNIMRIDKHHPFGPMFWKGVSDKS